MKNFATLYGNQIQRSLGIYPAVLGEVSCFTVQCLFNSFAGVDIVFHHCNFTHCPTLAYVSACVPVLTLLAPDPRLPNTQWQKHYYALTKVQHWI